VPPHLIADQLVAEARRAAGVAVALYVVDIDGSQLVRLAGSEDFPETLRAPPAIGPEIVPEGLPGFYTALREHLPRATAAPLGLRGRVIGLLLCVGASIVALDDIAKQGALALELASDYTDLIESARRRKPTTPAAEVQHQLLPPRLTRVTGGQLAGGLLPSYEVAGDWFDYVENRDGVWIGIADAGGTGPTGAAMSAALLGALRSARRAGLDLIGAIRAMDTVVRGLPNPEPITCLIARWHPPTGTLSWVSCGHPLGHRVSLEGELTQLEGPVHPELGAGRHPPDWVETSIRIGGGERLLLLTNGILDRQVEGGATFGLEGVRRALREAPVATAAATVMAIQHAITRQWTEPLEDDATLIVLAVE
jgi:serine phosphatase RsbU (regulator of sigma subunit)